MSDELLKSADRWRQHLAAISDRDTSHKSPYAFPCKESGCGWAYDTDAIMLDRNPIADAWLAEHPADDDELIEEEWLADHNFHAEQTGHWLLHGGCQAITLRRSATMPYHWTFNYEDEWDWPFELLSRGHLRRLLDCLGISLTRSYQGIEP